MTPPSASTLAPFIEAANAYHAALAAHAGPRKTDPLVDRINQEYQRLKASGEAHQLLELLESDQPGLRYSAAVYVLGFSPEEGVKTLSALAEGSPGSVAVLAFTTLAQWRAGVLNLL